jgi:hypothetical protein
MMLDLHEGILGEFAERAEPPLQVQWKKLGLYLSRERDEHAKRLWKAANKDKQREYHERWEASNPTYKAVRPESSKAKRRARYAERRAEYARLRASGLSRDEARARL